MEAVVLMTENHQIRNEFPNGGWREKYGISRAIHKENVPLDMYHKGRRGSVLYGAELLPSAVARGGDTRKTYDRAQNYTSVRSSPSLLLKILMRHCPNYLLT